MTSTVSAGPSPRKGSARPRVLSATGYLSPDVVRKGRSLVTKLARPGEGVELGTELRARDQVLQTLSDPPTRGKSRNSVPRVTKLPDLTPPAGHQVSFFASQPLGPSELPSAPAVERDEAHKRTCVGPEPQRRRVQWCVRSSAVRATPPRLRSPGGRSACDVGSVVPPGAVAAAELLTPG